MTERFRNLAKALVGYGLVISVLMAGAACAGIWLAKAGAV